MGRRESTPNVWLTTARNEILRKHGIIPEKPPSPTPMIEEAILEGRRLAHENRLEGKDLDELDELEDVEDAEFFEAYRAKRLSLSGKRETGAGVRRPEDTGTSRQSINSFLPSQIALSSYSGSMKWSRTPFCQPDALYP